MTSNFLRNDEALEIVLKELSKLSVIEDMEVNSVWDPNNPDDHRLIKLSIHGNPVYFNIPNNPNKPYRMHFMNLTRTEWIEGENIELMIKKAVIRMKI